MPAANARISLLANFTDLDTKAEVLTRTLMGRIACNGIFIQNDPTNTAGSLIFVCKRGVASPGGILGKVAVGGSYTLHTPNINSFDVFDFELEGTEAKLAICSFTRL
jgi:hypothetical protein